MFDINKEIKEFKDTGKTQFDYLDCFRWCEFEEQAKKYTKEYKNGKVYYKKEVV